MIDRIKRAVTGQGQKRLFCECRHCGSRIDDPTTNCPLCGSSEVARYDLES
ncbi:hypothetical protein [Halorientalis halophila]|uniref:hypothetical protein n=1 Tax=Halorientalis halophila TaxID=3108499 RepID=UPI00300B9D9B